MSWGQCFAAESQPRVWAGALRSSVTRRSINASRRSGLSGVMARQRVREFYDRAGINRFPLGDFLTQRLNTRSHAGERHLGSGEKQVRPWLKLGEATMSRTQQFLGSSAAFVRAPGGSEDNSRGPVLPQRFSPDPR